MGDPSLRLALDAALKEAPAFSVRHDHALPGFDVRLDHLVIGPMGVFVLCPARPTRLARAQQAQDLRRDLRSVRAVLDDAGLQALQSGGILCVANGRPMRFRNGTAAGDVTAVLDYLRSDRLHGAAIVRSALVALDPPPFIADVRPDRSAGTSARRPSVTAAAV